MSAHFVPARGLRLAVLFISAVLLAGLLAHAPAQAFSKPFRFSMTGDGKVTAVPDMARVLLEVRTKEKTAAAALRANTQAMRRVFDTLKKRFGIADKDMATSGFDISPVYFTPRDERGRPSGPARLVGYTVRNQLQVTVRDLNRLGGLLDAVVQSGANRVQGIYFDLSNREKLLNEARRKAVADAKAKAELYAQAVGFRLGPVVEVREGGIAPVPVRRMRFAAKAVAMEASAPVPVARGEQQVRVSVTITWEAMSE